MPSPGKQNFENRRRFQRITVDVNESASHKLLGLEAKWPPDEVVSVFDISYTGAALGRPTQSELKICQKCPLVFVSESLGEFKIDAEVVWFNDEVAGVQFFDLKSDSRIKLNQFLDDKLVGANLYPIEKKYFGPTLDCDFWFHGPADTNVYLWAEGKNITRVVAELESRCLEYVNDEVIISMRKSQKDTDVEMELEPQREFIKRVVSVLSQINEPKVNIKKLCTNISNLI